MYYKETRHYMFCRTYLYLNISTFDTSIKSLNGLIL